MSSSSSRAADIPGESAPLATNLLDDVFVAGHVASLWPILRALGRDGDVDTLRAFEAAGWEALTRHVRNSVRLGLGPTSPDQAAGLRAAAELLALDASGNADRARRLALLHRVASSFTPQAVPSWRLPTSDGVESGAAELVDALLADGVHPGLVAVADLLGDCLGTYRPGRAAEVAVLLARNVINDRDVGVATLTLARVEGPVGLFHNTVGAPFQRWDADFQAALDNAWAAAGAAGLSARWALSWQDGQPVEAVTGPSIGLAVGLALANLTEPARWPIERDWAVTGAIDSFGKACSLLGDPPNLRAYEEKIRYSKHRTVAVPAIDCDAIAELVRRNTQPIELYPVGRLDDLGAVAIAPYRVRKRLEEDARRWESADRHQGYLAAGSLLTPELLELAPRVSPVASEFVAMSAAEERRRRRRRRGTAAGLLAGGAAAVFLLGVVTAALVARVAETRDQARARAELAVGTTLENHEVSYWAYSLCLKWKPSQCTQPTLWPGDVAFPELVAAQKETGASPRLGAERYVLLGVSAEQAEAFCLWTGRRLPTMAQYEQAASIYPLAVAAASRGNPLQGQPKAPPASPGGNPIAGLDDTFAELTATPLSDGAAVSRSAPEVLKTWQGERTPAPVQRQVATRNVQFRCAAAP